LATKKRNLFVLQEEEKEKEGEIKIIDTYMGLNIG
jgi:hypothetical protein